MESTYKKECILESKFGIEYDLSKTPLHLGRSLWLHWFFFFCLMYTGTMNLSSRSVGFVTLFWNLNPFGMHTKLLVNIMRWFFTKPRYNERNQDSHLHITGLQWFPSIQLKGFLVIWCGTCSNNVCASSSMLFWL